MNSVNLIGNLATDVGLRDVGDDRKVASFLLAVPRPGDNGGAEFVRVAVWNKQGETCARYLSKGQRVGVQGRLHTHSWEDEGKRRTTVEVVARTVDFLTPPATAPKDSPFEAAVAP